MTTGEGNIVSGDQLQFLRRKIRLARDSGGLVGNRIVQEIPDVAPVAEVILPHLGLELFSGQFDGVRCNDQLLLPAEKLKDLKQLPETIVLEINERMEPALQAFIGFNEIVHLLGITRYNYSQIVPLVFHCLHQGVDNVRSKAVIFLFGDRISLVNEENAAKRLLNDLIRLGCALPDVTGNQVFPGNFLHMTFPQQTERMIEFTDHTCNGGFASSRFPAENQVKTGVVVGKAHGDTVMISFGQVHLLEDLILDIPEPDQFVQLFHNLRKWSSRRGACVLGNLETADGPIRSFPCLLPALRFLLRRSRPFGDTPDLVNQI